MTEREARKFIDRLKELCHSKGCFYEVVEKNQPTLKSIELSVVVRVAEGRFLERSIC